ncbi:MAG: double-CXXCG motif protein [Armatimonadota bacterium]
MAFWHLTCLRSRRDYGTPTDWDADRCVEQVVCPITRQHNRVRELGRGNLRVVYASGKVPHIFWPYLSGGFLVQEGVLRRFRDAALTGFEAKPVAEVRMPRLQSAGLRVPDLWEIVVTGWGGEAADESGVRMTYYCPGCGHVRYSVPDNPAELVDETKWDGSDFFRVYPFSLYVFVTERVAQLVRKERWRGVRLVRPQDLEFPGNSLTPLPPPPGREVRGPDQFAGVHIAS